MPSPAARRREVLDAAGVVGRDDDGALALLLERAVEQLRAGDVERVERLVEHEQRRVVQEHPAEREPLLHPARERRDALVAHLPEAEALEQHPDPLAAVGHAVEPAEEVQVLERRQLAVDERLVAEVADLAARRQLELALRRRREPGEHAQQRRLARPVRPGDEQEVAAHELDVDAVEDALHAEALRQVAGADHVGSVGGESGVAGQVRSGHVRKAAALAHLFWGARRRAPT